MKTFEDFLNSKGIKRVDESVIFQKNLLQKLLDENNKNKKVEYYSKNESNESIMFYSKPFLKGLYDDYKKENGAI